MGNINLTILLIAALTLFTKSAEAQKLESEFLYRITLTLDTSINIGNVGIGDRVIYPITGGSFTGSNINGKVRPTGADWMLRIDSTTTKLDVRLILGTDDGELIYNTYTGILHNRPDGTTY